MNSKWWVGFFMMLPLILFSVSGNTATLEFNGSMIEGTCKTGQYKGDINQPIQVNFHQASAEYLEQNNYTQELVYNIDCPKGVNDIYLTFDGGSSNGGQNLETSQKKYLAILFDSPGMSGYYILGRAYPMKADNLPVINVTLYGFKKKPGNYPLGPFSATATMKVTYP